MLRKKKYITDFIGLDLLRFILSITVVFRHYYHFYVPFNDAPFNDGIKLTVQPLYSVFGVVYNNGQFAVPVFWLISGLIFYTIYNDKIKKGKTDIKEFSVLRFTRLYPLHFLTLIVIAILQLIFFHLHDTYFVYQPNDFNHFFLQLFFMGSWLSVEQHSFNVPAWSVSVEIFVYLIFFLVAKAGLTKGRGLYLLVGLSVIMNFFGILPPFNQCMLFFFWGCLLARQMKSGKSLYWILTGYVVVSALLIVSGKFLKDYVHDDIGFLNRGVLFMLKLVPVASALVLLFIIAFRGMKSRFVTSLFKNLGNITYSVYLVHLPIQLIMFLIIQPNSFVVFNGPIMLFTFLCLSILIGWFVFEYFEKPVQRFLRRKFAHYSEGSWPTQEQGEGESLTDLSPIPLSLPAAPRKELP